MSANAAADLTASFFIFFVSPFLSFIALHQQHLTSLCVLVHHHSVGAVEFG